MASQRERPPRFEELSERLDMPALQAEYVARCDALLRVIQDARDLMLGNDFNYAEEIDALYVANAALDRQRLGRQRLLEEIDGLDRWASRNAPQGTAEWRERRVCSAEKLVKRHAFKGTLTLKVEDVLSAGAALAGRSGPWRDYRGRWKWLADWMGRIGLGEIKPNSLKGDWDARKNGKRPRTGK